MSNETTKVPDSIDDCDHLAILSSEDGEDCIYIKIHETKNKWYGEAVVDCGTGHWVEGYGDLEGPHDNPQGVEDGLLHFCQDWFVDQGIPLAEVTHWDSRTEVTVDESILPARGE
jgi:hypothetical protein